MKRQEHESQARISIFAEFGGKSDFGLHSRTTLEFPLVPPWTIPVTGVSNGMAGGAYLILTKAWRSPPQCRQWSVHCLGDTNTCGNRNALDVPLVPLGSSLSYHLRVPWFSWKISVPSPGFLLWNRDDLLKYERAWCGRVTRRICFERNQMDSKVTFKAS